MASMCRYGRNVCRRARPWPDCTALSAAGGEQVLVAAVNSRFDAQHAEHRMKQVIVSDGAVFLLLQAIHADAAVLQKLGRQPGDPRHFFLHFRGDQIRHAVQVQAVFAE